MLEQAGWKVQPKKKIDFNAGPGIAVREYETDVGPADCVLFVNKQAVGVIEAKPEYWGQKITTVEEQSQSYATAELKWVNNNPPLPFVYESTGVITRFTDGHDPKPCSREVFTFHRPETLQEWLTWSVPTNFLCQLRLSESLGLAGKSALKCGTPENLGGAVLLINSNWSRSVTLTRPKGKDGDDIGRVIYCKI